MKHCNLLFLLLILNIAAFAQRELRGVVRDAKTGSGLPSATVKVQGKQFQTVTTQDGNFSFSVPSGNSTLEVTYIGYGTKTIPVSENENDLVIALDESTADLSQVVVTALGISKEARKVGYSVTKVDGSQLTQARESNVAYSLAGRVAGLNVSGVSGGPGSSAKILLRGMTSITQAGSPLFVINGIPMDNTQRGASGEWGGADNGDGIANINPDDIESMTVLKGASASALYGTRAANGVILVTTKSGKKGTFSVELNSNYTVERAIDFTDYQYTYGQGQNGVKPQNVNDALNSGRLSWGSKLDGSQTIQWDGKQYPYSAVTDNIPKFYRNGPSFTNTLSVGSGTDKGNFRLSLSNLDAKSIMPNSGLKRNTVNLNINQTIWDKLNVGVMLNYVDERSDNRPKLSDGPQNANNIFFLAANVDQSILAPGYSLTSPKGSETQWNDNIYETNPYFVINRGINDLERKRLIGAITARYNFTDWLYLQGRVGYDQTNDRIFQVDPTGLAYSQNEMGGLGALRTSQIIELNPDVLAGVRRDITKDFSFDLSVGAALRRNKTEYLQVGGGPFVIPFLYSPFNVTSFNRDYNYGERESQSAYYSLDLSYKNYLTITTTGRYDTYSTLPSSDRSIFMPSVAGSFLFSELFRAPVLSYGKLRASFSQTSGEPTDLYITQQYYSVGNTINGVTTGSFSSSLPNLFLKPFTLSEIEVGADLKFLNNRIGLDVAYFNRKTKNEIFNGGLSSATGYTSQYIGTGSTQNSGLEVLVTGAIIQEENFTWNSSFNLTYVKNKVVDIYGSTSTNDRSQWGTYRPFNAYTYIIKGLSGPQVYAADYLRDAAGNKIIGADGIPVAGKQGPLGSTLPKYYGGWNNEFSYKGFNFAFLFDYKFGNKILSATKYYAILRGLDKMTLEGREGGIVADGVLENGTKNTKNVPAQTYYQELAKRIGALEVMDGSFVKLRQVTLGYTFDQKVLGRLPFQAITLSFVGRNLLTLVKHTDHVDPESGFSPNVRYSGIEGSSLPTTRSYGVNLNIKFKK
jgi:TonB-linked SusC/RagA family outer membrane protein